MADAPDDADADRQVDDAAESSDGSGPASSDGRGDGGTTSEATAGAEDPADSVDPGTDADALAAAESAEADDEELDELRERVDEKYDFEEFGPDEMAEMTVEEWQAAFDADAWVTGEELLDRLEADLRHRVAQRDVFAVVERIDGDRPRLVAYSDAGYAVVSTDGSVEGEGTVLRDVKPSVALASMPEYEVPDPPEDAGLPSPEEVPRGTGGLGNTMLQAVAGTMLLAGLGLLGAPLVASMGSAWLVATVAGLGFVVVSLVLLFAVANARLSGRFRAEEYRDRLRAAGVDSGERPEFLPVDDAEFED